MIRRAKGRARNISPPRQSRLPTEPRKSGARPVRPDFRGNGAARARHGSSPAPATATRRRPRSAAAIGQRSHRPAAAPSGARLDVLQPVWPPDPVVSMPAFSPSVTPPLARFLPPTPPQHRARRATDPSTRPLVTGRLRPTPAHTTAAALTPLSAAQRCALPRAAKKAQPAPANSPLPSLLPTTLGQPSLSGNCSFAFVRASTSRVNIQVR